MKQTVAVVDSGGSFSFVEAEPKWCHFADDIQLYESGQMFRREAWITLSTQKNVQSA